MDTVALNGQMMESLQDVAYVSEPKGIYLGIDRNEVKYKEDDIDFRYISDAIPMKPFLPASLGQYCIVPGCYKCTKKYSAFLGHQINTPFFL